MLPLCLAFARILGAIPNFLFCACGPERHWYLTACTSLSAQAVSLDRFAADLAVILALDWLLDRCRTAVNLLGDAFGVVLIDHLTRHQNAPGDGHSQPYSQLELT